MYVSGMKTKKQVQVQNIYFFLCLDLCITLWQKKPQNLSALALWWNIAIKGIQCKVHLGCGEQSQRRLQCVIIPPEGRLASKRTNGNGSGFTRCIAKTVGFLWTTKILPPSVCLTVNAAFLKTNLCQNDRKGILHLKIATWKKNMNISVKWETSNGWIHLWKRRGETTATPRHAEQPTTKSGRRDQRGCRDVLLLLTEFSCSFKADVSHCQQEVMISRPKLLYCDRMCIQRNDIGSESK